MIRFKILQFGALNIRLNLYFDMESLMLTYKILRVKLQYRILGIMNLQYEILSSVLRNYRDYKNRRDIRYMINIKDMLQ